MPVVLTSPHRSKWDIFQGPTCRMTRGERLSGDLGSRAPVRAVGRRCGPPTVRWTDVGDREPT